MKVTRSQETLKERRARWCRENARRREFARELHQALIRVLGGKCDRCEGDETMPLTIDHVDGARAWDIRQLNSVSRVQKYVDEFYEGVELRVLCLSCNSDDRNIRAKQLEEAPF